MPSQRGARGSYAKYICTHCRKRKIKCDLPVDIDIDTSRGAQPAATSCQRCIAKGLDCVVDFTILGRPSTAQERRMTRNSFSSKSSRLLPGEPSHNGQTPPCTSDARKESRTAIDDYLIVQPQKAVEPNEPTSIPKRRRPQPASKLQAMTNPSYLLSTLLQRDRQFASRLFPKRTDDANFRHLVDLNDVSGFVAHLVWHRLYFPDIPPIAALREQVLDLDVEDPEYLPVTFLYVLLCLLAMESARLTDVSHACLENLALHLAQRTILTLPSHRYAMLGLELLTAYKPMLLASDKELASNAIRARVVPVLLAEMAQDLGIDSSSTKLRQQLLAGSLPLDSDLLDDGLKWFRLCLRDDILTGGGRQGEHRQLMGETLVGIVELLRMLLESDHLPSGHVLAYHSLLCQAKELELMLRVKEDWRNLENLSSAIDEHKEACEWQRQALKASVFTLRPGEALVTTQLIDMQLHSAYCWVSGSATFYAVMAGAQAQHSSTDLSAEQALDVSDQIIERFAKSTSHKHASEPHTAFLIKYGSSRMDALELTLLNFVSAMDNLVLDEVPYVPPTKDTTSQILYTVKDIMEGQAARMKGWGGLHERTHMHLLLIRDCANSLERMGARFTGVTGAEAITKGCLWASTARLLRSLHRLLSEWKEWNMLGQVKVSMPVGMNDKDDQNALGLEGFELIPDDLFFDWDLWLREENLAVQ